MSEPLQKTPLKCCFAWILCSVNTMSTEHEKFVVKCHMHNRKPRNQHSLFGDEPISSNWKLVKKAQKGSQIIK